MKRSIRKSVLVSALRTACCMAAVSGLLASSAFAASMADYGIVKLQSLDKVTARTMTFEAKVGSTIKFGQLFIKVQACRKTPPIERPEAASFLQIWEVSADKKAQWVFSGWMFASSPGMSSMDHPIFDVWVIDCLGEPTSGPDTIVEDDAAPDGIAKPDAANPAPETQDFERLIEMLGEPGASESGASESNPPEAEGTTQRQEPQTEPESAEPAAPEDQVPDEGTQQEQEPAAIPEESAQPADPEGIVTEELPPMEAPAQ